MAPRVRARNLSIDGAGRMIGTPQGLWRSRLLILGGVLAVAGGIAAGSRFLPGPTASAQSMEVAIAEEDLAPELATPPVDRPTDAPPTTEARPAEEDQSRRILVSTRSRRLWLVQGRDTLFRAPIAIGMGKNFEYEGRKYRFETPVGRRTVIGKQKDPLWTVPEWHYYEKATEKGLEAVKLQDGARILLGDSSYLVVQDGEVGRINQFGYFHAWTPGSEIIFDGKIFIPPLTSPQRRVPDALGPYKLDMGDGYLIHGTHIYNEETIGEAVSHGCIRMRNADLIKLYPMVPRGTAVEIF
jgi:lipoprotein-anchoring transpeptidase ErfK/SrfK